MGNLEEMKNRALEGLEKCRGKWETGVGCETCPYREYEYENCLVQLYKDAHTVIGSQDLIIKAMLGEFGDACDVGCGEGETAT